jgi:hypothetical protein
MIAELKVAGWTPKGPTLWKSPTGALHLGPAGAWRRMKQQPANKEATMPIDKPYAYHEPSTDGLAKITELRALFSLVERKIKEICPAGRQQSIALTNNEQTAMWSIKAVVFNDPASVVKDT